MVTCQHSSQPHCGFCLQDISWDTLSGTPGIVDVPLYSHIEFYRVILNLRQCRFGRLGADAFDVALEPAEARLLLPFVLGLAGEFDNAGIQSAATNLFTVRSFLAMRHRFPVTP